MTEMATSARVVTAETPAILAQRPRACADRAIRSARSPGSLKPEKAAGNPRLFDQLSETNR